MCLIALAVAAAASIAGARPTPANAEPWFGQYSLTYGDCCSGAKLQGTRAEIGEARMNVPSVGCIMFLSGANSQYTNNIVWIEVGLAKCGSDNGTGGDLDDEATCHFVGDTYKYIETYNASLESLPSCTAEGEANIGQQYQMTAEETASGSGRYEARIDGYDPIDFSGFNDSSTQLIEEAEQNGYQDCSTDWSVAGTFNNWERWNYAIDSWYTVEQSVTSEQCAWSDTPLYYTPPDENYFDTYANYP